MRKRFLMVALAVVGTAVGARAASPVRRMDPERFLIGAYCLQQNARTDAHVRDIRDAHVDFIIDSNYWDDKTLDLFQKYGLGVIVGGYLAPYGWGIPYGYGYPSGQVADSLTMDMYGLYVDAFQDHPAKWGLHLTDEPSALDFPHYGQVAAMLQERLPELTVFANLFPNYALSAQNGEDKTRSQLGTTTYREYIDEYCRNVPLDYISWDYYPFLGQDDLNPSIRRYYDNLLVVAEACHRTDRRMTCVIQVNSCEGKAPLTANQLRFQAFTAMSFGATELLWACWCRGWWENNVLDGAGNRTEQYEKLKAVNAEIKRLAPEYMRFRNVATRFVGFVYGGAGAPGDVSAQFADAVDVGPLKGIRASDGSPLVVGEMVPKDAASTDRAAFVTVSDDPGDANGRQCEVLVDAPNVLAFGGAGPIAATRDGEGTWHVPVRSNQGVLIETGCSADDSFENLAVGTVADAIGGWTGKGSVERADYSPATPPGYPLPELTHERVLNAENESSRRLPRETLQGMKSDVMVRLQRPIRDLTAPPDDIRVGLACDNVGRLCLWHKYRESGVWKRGWTPLSESRHEEGEWVRIGLEFDESACSPGEALVRVRVNGSCQPTARGVRAPDDDRPYGAWHYQTKGCRDDASDDASAVSFSGAKVDDFIVSSRDVETRHAGATAADGIDFAWFDSFGLPRDPKAAAPFVPGYLLSDVHAAGLDPYSERPLTVTAFGRDADGTVHLTFNGYKGDDPGSGYRILCSATPDFGDPRNTGVAEGVFHGDAASGSTSWSGKAREEPGGCGFYRIEAFAQ